MALGSLDSGRQLRHENGKQIKLLFRAINETTINFLTINLPLRLVKDKDDKTSCLQLLGGEIRDRSVEGNERFKASHDALLLLRDASGCLRIKMAAKVHKVIQDAQNGKRDVDLVERTITSFNEIPQILSMVHITRLNLAHNRLKSVPPAIGDLVNLESLNLYNNQIEELPTSLSGLQRLRILKLGLNRLWTLPRGFGAFPVLEILDLTYNNLNERALPGNFFMIQTLRALYLGDNDFEVLPADVGNLQALQVLVLRDNDLTSLPREIGRLKQLRELHIEGNRLQVLPPEVGQLDIIGPRQIFRLEDNPWISPIIEQLQIDTTHLMDLLKSSNYLSMYSRHLQSGPAIPPMVRDKNRKISRRKD